MLSITFCGMNPNYFAGRLPPSRPKQSRLFRKRFHFEAACLFSTPAIPSNASTEQPSIQAMLHRSNKAAAASIKRDNHVTKAAQAVRAVSRRRANAAYYPFHYRVAAIKEARDQTPGMQTIPPSAAGITVRCLAGLLPQCLMKSVTSCQSEVLLSCRKEALELCARLSNLQPESDERPAFVELLYPGGDWKSQRK